MRLSLSFTVVCRLIATLCGVATSFISLRLYNLYLTKEVYGTVLVALQFLSYLPLVGGGFGMVLGQQMLAGRDTASVARTARFYQTIQTYMLAVALPAALVLMAAYSRMPTAHAQALPLVFFLLVGVGGVATYYSGGQMGLLTALGRQIYSITLQAGWSVLGLMLLWGFFSLGWGVWAMPASTVLGPLLLLPVAWLLQRRLIAGVPFLTWQRDVDFWPRVQQAWRPSLAWLQSQVAIMLMFTLDIILVGFLFGPGPAAVYGIISRITSMSRQVIQSLCETAWPKLAQEPDEQRRLDLMRKVDRLNAWVAGAWYGAMGATLHPFLGWLVKTDWVAGPLLLGLMLARNLIVSLSAPHAYGLLSAASFKELARACQREVILAVIAIFIFGHFFGVIGVALATLTSTVGGSLWYLTYAYFRLFPKQNWFREWSNVYARGIAGAAISFLVALITWREERLLWAAPGWLAMVAGGIGLAAGLFVALVFARGQSGPLPARTRLLQLPTRW